MLAQKIEDRAVMLYNLQDSNVAPLMGELRQLFYHKYAIIYVLEYQTNLTFAWNPHHGYLYETEGISLMCPILSDADHRLFINVSHKIVVKRNK